MAYSAVTGRPLPGTRFCGFVMQMTTRPTPKDPRKQRLAQALRDNLKRRKAQMRGRAEEKAADDEGISGKVSSQKA